MESNPLILTLSLNKEASAYFTNLRDQHFPPERNFLKAHLTLFHKLPQGEESILKRLNELALRQAPLLLEVSSLLFLGQGVAFQISSSALLHLHQRLQHAWHSFLSPQDQQKLRPHITIQNKVSPSVARQLLENLLPTFCPFTITSTGLQLWEYQGGPWKPYQEFKFREENP